ncbi:MAG: four-carbon acid sugar kinase family protein [Geminicoccaceae bacterium]
MTQLPPGPLVSFYGDDFTGSTAVMEVLSFAGLPTVLFIDVPTAEQLEAFDGYRGIGIAGVARSKSPDWMEVHLPPIFSFLARIRAPIAHYKVCSTFDSAPHVGSIGRAANLAIPVLGGDWHPLLVAAPAIHRYQAFGNLFALVDGEGFRLDRHPTMARHPVTPMTEADIRLHLAQQTDRPIALVDFIRLKNGSAEPTIEHINAIDVVDRESLEAAGKLIWENRGERLFAIGSQGIEYALVEHWRAEGLIGEPPATSVAEEVEHIAVVSGSCSPVTARQIEHALGNGFEGIALDAARAVDEAAWTAELARAQEAALRALSAGRDPLAYTALGPDDPSIIRLSEAVQVSGEPGETVHERIGRGLGQLLSSILERTKIDRAVIAGGDSSGHGALEMGIHALTAYAPIAPGSMLCEAHRDGKRIQLALKGGQMGGPGYFSAVKRGRPSPIRS